jgi:NTP pyrophosphatase (non-canonical NTP hydrolase)
MKDRIDLELKDRRILFEHIIEEHDKQIAKWGVQSATLAEWMLWATEEFGELAQAIGDATYRGCSWKDAYKEAIQTATLILKIAEIIRNIPYMKNLTNKGDFF